MKFSIVLPNLKQFLKIFKNFLKIFTKFLKNIQNFFKIFNVYLKFLKISWKFLNFHGKFIYIFLKIFFKFLVDNLWLKVPPPEPKSWIRYWCVGYFNALQEPDRNFNLKFYYIIVCILWLQVSVDWGKPSVLHSILACMHTARRRDTHRWRYFVNLVGHEFPLKTNLELVRVLRSLHGANIVHVVRPKYERIALL